MASKKGNLSINSENMFPIIKKWLYSDHDIFYREVISNACDAITKIKKMDMMGEYQLPDEFKPRVDIILNDKDKTIKIVDNGIGMTAGRLRSTSTRWHFPVLQTSSTSTRTRLTQTRSSVTSDLDSTQHSWFPIQ